MRAVPLVLVFAACTEQGFTGTAVRSIAVVTGDFDDVAEPLDRMSIDHVAYDGIISNAVWDPEYADNDHTFSIESLLQEDNMGAHDAIFVASGARGLGDVVYNGVARDDQLVSDWVVRDNVVDYVARGNTLFVTDWAYDLVEACWPGAIDFHGDELQLDAAQAGVIDTVIAEVTDERLAKTTGNEQLAIHYNFSNWAVIDAVRDDVTVWLRGDVGWRRPGDGGLETQANAPLLVSFTPDGLGRVVVATFHIDAQNDPVADEILNTVAGPFRASEAEETE